jgi:hypothetical protein
MKCNPVLAPNFTPRPAPPNTNRMTVATKDRVEIGRTTQGTGERMLAGFFSGAVCAAVGSFIGSNIGHGAGAAAGFAIGGIFGAMMGYCSPPDAPVKPHR